MVDDTLASFEARITGRDHAASIHAEGSAHARRAPAPNLSRPARDHRKDRVGRANLAREGQALRAARRPSPRRRSPRGVAARAPRRAGVPHLPRRRALLSPALRRRTRLGGRAHRRTPGLEGSGVAGPAGLSRGGAAPAPAGDRRGRASHPPAEEILMRVIDMECSIPKNENTAPAASAATPAERPLGYGMANYGRIFRSRAE